MDSKTRNKAAAAGLCCENEFSCSKDPTIYMPVNQRAAIHSACCRHVRRGNGLLLDSGRETLHDTRSSAGTDSLDEADVTECVALQPKHIQFSRPQDDSDG